MKKLLSSAVVLGLVFAGCAVTDYPVLTDTRGDFSGVIRTGHKAYIVPTSSVATIYPDGSDELFSMVQQNQYGDQRLYTFNNYDPTAAVLLLDQTYCDWRYEGCEIVRAENPANAAVDDPLDYELYPSCSGARSLSLLVEFPGRVGECGDRLFSRQALSVEFANLGTTTWRGEEAYILPISDAEFAVTLTGTSGRSEGMPLYGAFNGLITSGLDLLLPMTPNARHQMGWLADFAATNGRVVTASITYNSLSTEVRMGLAADGLRHNMNRF